MNKKELESLNIITKIEKEHKRSTLMSKTKEDLVNQIVRLEYNNNALSNTINQQCINFKKIQHDTFRELESKAFTVDSGQNETDVVRLVDIEDELLW
jgi:actin-related protein